ncbi:TetR/AcrR family transcriptional regulator [Pradoshia sp.]
MFFSALKLFAAKGYKNTSVLEIVESAHVSKTTFYQQFASKEALVVALCRDLIDEIALEVKRAAMQEPRVSYKAYAGIYRYLEICFTNPPVANFILLESVGISEDVENVRREAMQGFADLIFVFAYQEFPDQVREEEIHIISQAMVGAINEVVIRNLKEANRNLGIEELSRLLNRLVIGAFVNLSNNY